MVSSELGRNSSTRRLGAAFCREEFTIAELRRVYEVIWGAPLDPRNFHRKVTGTPGFVIPTQHRTTRDGGRPARPQEGRCRRVVSARPAAERSGAHRRARMT